MVERVAKRTVIVDDLDGTDNASTIRFSVDKDVWEIDLAPHNVAQLREALAPFITKAEKVSSVPRKRSRNPQSQKVREWAAANGHKVPPRGKVPAAIQDAYARAHR